jgi:hypothetical protein
MTAKEHKLLYDELKQCIYTRGSHLSGLTQSQRHFVEALELSAFGAELLKTYAELVEKTPDIKLRDLHAFILGFALGTNDYAQTHPVNTEGSTH